MNLLFGVLFLFLPIISALHEDGGTCAKRCIAATKFSYPAGSTFEYEYALKSHMSVSGAHREAKMELTATVLLTPITQCDFSIQITDVVMQPQDSLLIEQLSQYPLTFAFQDGQIEEVCPDPRDTTDSINIKKGILSSMQNTMEALDTAYTGKESDVSGTCVTEYTLDNSDWFGPSAILKKKDFNQCDHRYVEEEGLYGVELWNRPISLLRSSQLCRQTIEKKQLKEVTCEESHQVAPVAKDEAATTSTTTQTLRLRRQTNADAIRIGNISKRMDILYSKEDETTEDVTEVANLLNTILTESRDHVNITVNSKFSRLVLSLRKLSLSQLKHVYSQGNRTKRMEQLFVDAISVTRSGAAIAMMHELLLNGVVGSDQTSLWYTTLAFTANPDEDMLEAALGILSAAPSKQATLSISALVGRYCALHPDCDKQSPARAIINHFSRMIGSTCTSSDEEDILLTLKALGNVGKIVNNMPLSSCFKEKSKSTHVRIAALKAVGQLPCDHISTLSLDDEYGDVTNDPELRITAYLLAASCINERHSQGIRQVLSTEPINEVTSFIWSHISNKVSQSEEEPYLSYIVQEPELKRKFDESTLGASRSYDIPLAGAHAHLHTIFQESKLPRSMNFEFDVDVFGKRFNLLEVGSRLEHPELFLEGIFGDNGYFPENHVAGLIEAMKSNIIDEQKPSPSVDAFLKVFGKEIAHGKLTSIQDIKSSIKDWDLSTALKELMRDKKVDYSKASQLLNARVTITSGSGLPLTVSLSGTSLLRFKASFNMDTSITAADVHILFQPSASIEVKGNMMLRAGNTETGIEMLATLNTATTLDAGFTYKQGRILNARINMPNKKQDIISVKAQTFVVNNEERKILQGKAPTIKNFDLCTDGGISQQLGVQLCSNLKVKSGITGPLVFNVFLQKVDDFSEYVFEIKKIERENVYKFVVVADTPGSKRDRRRSFSGALDFEKNKLNIGLHASGLDVALHGRYRIGSNRKLDLVVSANKMELLSLHCSLEEEAGGMWSSKVSLQVLENTIFKAKWELGNLDVGNLLAGETSLASIKEYIQLKLEVLELHVSPLLNKIIGKLSATL